MFNGFDTDLGDRVDDGKAGSSTNTSGTTGSGSTSGTGGSTTPTTAPTAVGTPTELLQQADALFAEADAALGQSPPDFTTYQEKQAAARELIRQALAAMGN